MPYQQPVYSNPQFHNRFKGSNKALNNLLKLDCVLRKWHEKEYINGQKLGFSYYGIEQLSSFVSDEEYCPSIKNKSFLECLNNDINYFRKRKNYVPFIGVELLSDSRFVLMCYITGYSRFLDINRFGWNARLYDLNKRTTVIDLEDTTAVKKVLKKLEELMLLEI